MDIRQLTYFMEVARQGSFTKAAQRLHMTQPSLSKMVRLLEEELDVTLFDRSSKQIELTDAGESILRSAREVMASLERMASELDDVVQAKRGRLRLGIPPMIGGRLFPSILESFHSRYPQIRLELAEHGGKVIEAAVDSGELDAGLVILPVVSEDKFHMLPCIEEALQVVVHPGHWAAARPVLRMQELEHEAFILFKDEFTLRDLILGACRDAGFEPDVAFESTQWDFMTELVAARFGITLLPRGVAMTLDPARFSVIPVERPAIRWRLHMIWKKDRYLSFAAREWIAFMRKSLEDGS
ncbi:MULTISPECIES: LysR family transcriptional regulator [unclassified Paenibacillus]|uniref:LysR family transcriptional regulator n=1 Tax=unclassified Paenibacillus TaxID=185978 RepID=UPI0009563D60|nr:MULTISPECIES: LysR family transcriptional regulator [unclassified Paenibacillus]ASS68277.1 LysR family transcriptional regulator [Paenibacillus sp. RUD330]SIR27156.1 DNA-binding transcriptional regulator, LysR family [Paenibacillus sp. RU4X]SIR39828.1 DNA-binding transcriptional regulator, LysR family [Paenibacillus sp. RU4T]